ncbi:MAG: site-specific integrase [Pseudomonadota bacterium]
MPRRLIEHKVRALKPKPKRYAIAEDGLTLEVHPSGKKSWHARYRQGRVQHKETLGTYPDVSVKEARAKVLEIQHRLKVEQQTVKQSRLLLKDYIDGKFKTWCESARQDSYGTLKRLKHHFVTSNPTIGNTMLKDLTTHQIETWKVQSLKKLKPSTVKRGLGDLRRVLNLAVEWGDLRVNPATKVQSPTVDNESTKLMLDDDEWSRLEAAIERWEYLSHFGTSKEKQLHPLWFPMYLRIMLNTGGRRNEVLELRWGDVDQKNRMITFPGIRTKNSKTRRIPISDDLVDDLQRYNSERVTGSTNEGQEVLAKKGERIFPVDSIRKPWARLKDMAKLPHISPHILRHHVASTLIREGASLAAVRDLLGHKDISVTTRYLSVLTEDKLKAVNLLSRRRNGNGV